ncbi:MAG: SBBP repeat-containing protein [Acidobacteria bacterium]|nr:SBBP repeat-containing protein [Acidobacteriota bacterium]
MFRALVVLVSLGAVSLFGDNVQLVSSLPDGVVSNAVQVDAAGNIYVAGYFNPHPSRAQDERNAFVAKLSPDASRLLYFTELAGSSYDVANALALGADGSVYITGATASFDFPVTSGALQTSLQVSIQPGAGVPNAWQAFLVRLNPNGTVTYSTFLGGSVSTRGIGIAVGSKGEVFVSGSGSPGVPVTSGAPARGPGGFLLKFDAGLSTVLLSLSGYGGLIVLDKDANIYLAGTAMPYVAGSSPTGPILALPVLSTGAFQPTHSAQFCSQTTGPSGFATNCSYQYVAKLDGSGMKLLWATYVTGTYGAVPAGIATDEAGNVIVAGTTNSDDYPVTPGAFQMIYAPAPLQIPTFGFPVVRAPAATGHVSKVSASGAALVWSTYFGGSYTDHITGMRVGASGDIYLSGRTGSSDLAGLADVPSGCRPSADQALGFIARIASDGDTAAVHQLVHGAPACLYSSCAATINGFEFGGWPLALRANDAAVVAGVNGNLGLIDFSPGKRLGCVVDPANNVQLNSVAPGQLITLFGTDLAPAAPLVPEDGVAASSTSFGVFFDGISAPILYSSAQQINVQVPYEISGRTAVQLQLVSKEISPPVSEARVFRVVDRQPSIFLSPAALRSPFPGLTVCGSTVASGEAAVALNEDGTLNDCANPAVAGSVVTMFLNGSGPVNPAQSTGAIALGPPVSLTPAVDAGSLAISTTTSPGSITGVVQIQLQLPETLSPEFAFTVAPTLAGTPMRERPILIWTRPK